MREVFAPPGECLSESEKRSFSSNESSIEAAVQRAVASPRAHHGAGVHFPVDAPDEKTLRKISFEGENGRTETHLGARALCCGCGQRVQALSRDRKDGRREIRFDSLPAALHQCESRDRLRICLSKLFLHSHFAEDGKRLVGEKTSADFRAWEPRLLEDDDARSGPRERRGGGGAGEAAPDDGHVAVVYAVYARFHTSSHTKREIRATRAPGRAVSATWAVSSGV